MRVIEERNQIEKEFGFSEFFDITPRLGWLLNYRITRNDASRMFLEAFFVDEVGYNFKARVPYYPSFLIPILDKDEASLQEDLDRAFKNQILRCEMVNRVDPSQHNHLNKPPKCFLAVYALTENDFSEITKILLSRERDGIEFLPEKIYEHDIPIEVQAASQLKVCCGKWYSVVYDGCDYRISPADKISYPDLRIMAFDIETTKPPLKFPSARSDSIMMISAMTDRFGELIINREYVSEDITEFEYEAKEDMRCTFQISNERDEEGLLIRFIELIQEYRPHIVTTYNGGAFDWPFVDQRAGKYGITLPNTIGMRATNEYYDCHFILHLDCYRWVKRDSYLPMNSQGLKEVTRIKLGYYPDEIDPEDMVRLAIEQPQKMASYSASDAVATFYLYMKYVHPHIFSVSSIIPLPPVQILCKGSGTLCEALLFSEALCSSILIPSKKFSPGLEYYNGHLVESLTYVGGHVESLRAGVFRADFDHDFECSPDLIDLIKSNLGVLMGTDSPGEDDVDLVANQLERMKGKSRQRGVIYHLDVGAMYPNIILTNRMQPIAVVNDDICIHCDFNRPDSACKRKMQWVSRVEYYPPSDTEINMIKNQLQNELFYRWEEGKSDRILYAKLPVARQEAILKERISEYSKKIYKKLKATETRKREVTICQKELPFYVDTVRRFRDQRNVVKGYYKRAMKEYDANPTIENYKMMGVYNSLQVAYKCILNSFYGYVMRTGSRWFSLEMAAAVCHVGGEIIRLAREFVEKIGIVLELDTDGIWCLVPESFPSMVAVGKQKIPFLANILNHFVCRQFTNHQYHTEVGVEGTLHGGNNSPHEQRKYEISSANSIAFEIDGPYKTMVVPSSTEENKMLKKRYAVFDFRDKICELKGFELKRRGELNLIKKFQEDLFRHFNDGNTLVECYQSLAETCNYWLDIIYSEGMGMADEDIIELFSETRNMSKNIEEYGGRNSSITSTAKKLSEFLGQDMMEDKLKCEFIICRYPLNAPTVARTVPVLIFRHPEKAVYLKKWLKIDLTSLKAIIDWEYYKKRFEAILQRLIVIPAHFQKIDNPIGRVQVPKWVRNADPNRLDFGVEGGWKRTNDIEDAGGRKSVNELFGSSAKKTKGDSNAENDSAWNDDCNADDEDDSAWDDKVNGEFHGGDDGELHEECLAEDVGATSNHESNGAPASKIDRNAYLSLGSLRNAESLRKFVDWHAAQWKAFCRYANGVMATREVSGDAFQVFYGNGRTERREFIRTIYLEVNSTRFFKDYQRTQLLYQGASLGEPPKSLVVMQVPEKKYRSQEFQRFLGHFSIVRAGGTLPISFQLAAQSSNVAYDSDCIIISSFMYGKKPIFAITSGALHPASTKTSFCSDIRGLAMHGVLQCSFDSYAALYLQSCRTILFSKTDISASKIGESFKSRILVPLEIPYKASLGAITELLAQQRSHHVKIKEEYQRLVAVASFGGIPVSLVDGRVFDVIFYKELMRAGILPRLWRN